MKTLTEQLAQYAAYHRDHRNVWTHFVGIPMIVLAVVTLLSRPMLMQLDVGTGSQLALSPAAIVSLIAGLFYLRLDVRYGMVMSLLLALCCMLGATFAQGSTPSWLAWGVGLFVAGWIIQFIGHWFEGRKPAFVDDLVGLAIGPLFVVAEMGFMIGLRREVHDQVVEVAGALR
jgi:uncharacterized membrane protein YGL010W